MDIFTEINEMSAREILSVVRLPMAKDGKSYVCPCCGHGKGGDGIKPEMYHGKLNWHCYGKCGKHMSNFDLAAEYFELSNYSMAEQVKRLKEEFGLPDDNATFSFSREKNSSWSSWTAEQKAALSFDPKGAVEMDEKKSASDKEPKNYAKFYEVNRANVNKFLAERGGSFRGLTAATFEKYGVVVHPDFGVEGHEKRPHLIIPYDDYHFVARAIEGHDRSQHGQDAPLYEPLPISVEFPNFVVEGEIDALSITQAIGSLGIRCIATGGASKYGKVVPELEKRFGNSECKPSFIVLFDNDEAGKVNGLQLVTMLRAAGYPAKLSFLEEEKSEKVDANDLLRRDYGELIKRLLNVLENAGEELKRQSASIENAKERAKAAAVERSGMKDFPMADYFAVQFFKDIELSARYSERKTGFANLDGTGEFESAGQKQIFAPGLYMLGATPGAGKTTFAWQLLNQLADAGEPCIFCSYEMSRLELYTKSIARELFKQKKSGHYVMALSAADIRRGVKNGGIEEVIKLAAKFARTNAKLLVRELSNVNVVELIESLKPLVVESEKPPVVVIDYLQIIPPTSSKATAKENVDDIMRRLKDFQRETNSTLVVVSAFNRASNQNSEPALTAFRESSSIEYSCDCAWLLQTENGEAGMKKNPRSVKLICRKNRNGAVYEVFFSYYCANDYFQACNDRDFGGDDDE